MSSRAAWAVLALSLVGGCLDHTPLGPGSDVVVVHAVLNPATAVQHISVRHSGVALVGGRPVHDATVTLTAPDGSARSASEVATPVVEQNLDARYDVAVDSLMTGVPYHLRVVTADGTIIEGDAIVPAAPALRTMPEWRLDAAKDTLRLSWPRATGVRAYEVRISQRAPQPDSTGTLVYPPGGDSFVVIAELLANSDTSMAIAGSARARARPAFFPGVYDVVVSAVDDNYYEYFAHQSDPYTPTPLPSSLRGGVGLFGAFVPILRQTIVVEGRAPGT